MNGIENDIVWLALGEDSVKIHNFSHLVIFGG